MNKKQFVKHKIKKIDKSKIFEINHKLQTNQLKMILP